MKTIAAVFSLLFSCIALAGDMISIQSVTAQQRYPWNGQVDIAVTFEGSADDVAEATCSFTATNCATGAAVPVTSVIQNGDDTGSDAIWTRRFIWNATNDVGEVKIDDLALTVEAKVMDGVQLWENGPYWAKCNVGATKPEEYGYYFWWGDTVGYTYDGGKWNAVDGSESNFRFSYDNEKIVTMCQDDAWLIANGYIDDRGNLTDIHDAARKHCGLPWRMPTNAEHGKLCDSTYCNWVWQENWNGVRGYLVTGVQLGYTNKRIFLPAAGYGNDDKNDGVKMRGRYWSSTKSDYLWNGSTIAFSQGWLGCSSGMCRYGKSIRPVREFFNGGETIANASATTHLMIVGREWNGASYAVRFDGNGGSGIMENQAHTVSVRQSLSKCVFTRTGYAFIGWATTSSGVVEYEDEEEVQNLTMQSGNTVSLYAVWSPIQYSIVYNANGGTGSMPTQTAIYDKESDIAACGYTRSGFAFVGWATTWNGKVAYVDEQVVKNLTTIKNSTVVLYAVWREKTVSFSVEFDAQGGECVEIERSVERGKTVGSLPIPTRRKYKFDGWYTAPSDGTKVTASTKVTADVTYYAHWTYDGSATVSVNVGSGCLDMGTVSGGKTAKAGTKVTLKATAKSGYVFAGWYRDAEFDEPVEGDVDYRTPSYSYVVGEDDAAFYARFIPASDDDVEIWTWMDEDYERGVAIEPIEIEVFSESLPTVKVTGLPTGLKFTAKALDVKATRTTDAAHYAANTIYGTPTKSGVYVVTITATTAGKMTATEQFRMIVRGANEYAVSAKGVYRCPLNACCCEYTPSLGAVSGSGVYAPGKTVTLKAPAAPKGQVFAGWYATDDLKYADDEYWWGDPPEDFFEACSPVGGASDYRNSSMVVTVGYEDVGYYALYMYSDFDTVLSTSLEDRYVWEGYDYLPVAVESYSLPKITVSGLPSGLKFDAKKNAISGTPTKPGTYTVKLAISNQTIKKAILQTIEIFVPNLHGGADAGVVDGLDYSADAYTMNVAVSDGYPEFTVTTGAKVSVAGLPSGLKYDAQNGRITGVPTKAGVFTATITTTVGTERFVDTVTIKVDALPSWAYGTFNGGSDYGQAQLMISSAGRLSGKYLEDGISYALSAPSFDSHEYGMYHANATVSWTYKDENNKTVKQSELWTIFVEKGAIGGVLTSDRFDAWQNVWAQTVWKGVGLDLFTSRGAVKKLMGDDYGLGDGESVTLTIKPNGTVTVKGVFDTGKTDSRGKAVCYTASGSAVVCVTEDDPFAGQIFVYFPPNAAKGFGGYVWCVQVGE